MLAVLLKAAKSLAIRTICLRLNRFAMDIAAETSVTSVAESLNLMEIPRKAMLTVVNRATQAPNNVSP